MRSLLAFLALGLSIAAAQTSKTVVLSNDKLALTINLNGATFVSVVIKEDPALSPLAAMGHFLALDGFGAPSDAEAKAGMPFHGEASHQTFSIVPNDDSGKQHTVSMRATLPLAQETLTRTAQIVNDENVIYVTSQLQSALSVDRPISWAEHVTIGPPFLEKGKVVVDMPATNCRVRPYKPGGIPGHLVYGEDFVWPMAPVEGGGTADIRQIPTDHNWLDLATCQIDPTRKLAFVSALHTEKHLLFGYVFCRDDYPWVMSWMNFTGDNRAARGMEFSSQPFDVSHRDTVSMSPLFGVPTFRWLPAKSSLETRFLLFYTKVPEDFTQIDDVAIGDGKLIILDHSRKTLVLAASRSLW